MGARCAAAHALHDGQGEQGDVVRHRHRGEDERVSQGERQIGRVHPRSGVLESKLYTESEGKGTR